jgi:hypothetical protein
LPSADPEVSLTALALLFIVNVSPETAAIDLDAVLARPPPSLSHANLARWLLTHEEVKEWFKEETRRVGTMLRAPIPAAADLSWVPIALAIVVDVVVEHYSRPEYRSDPKQQFVVLHYFDTEHREPEDPLRGLQGLIRSLISQLLLSPKCLPLMPDLSFIQSPTTLEDCLAEKPEALMEVFQRLLAQVSSTIDVWMVIEVLGWDGEGNDLAHLFNLVPIPGAIPRLREGFRLPVRHVMLSLPAIIPDRLEEMAEEWTKIDLSLAEETLDWRKTSKAPEDSLPRAGRFRPSPYEKGKQRLYYPARTAEDETYEYNEEEYLYSRPQAEDTFEWQENQEASTIEGKQRQYYPEPTAVDETGDYERFFIDGPRVKATFEWEESQGASTIVEADGSSFRSSPRVSRPDRLRANLQEREPRRMQSRGAVVPISRPRAYFPRPEPYISIPSDHSRSRRRQSVDWTVEEVD